MKISE